MTLILTQSEIRALLPMGKCMQLVAQAFVCLEQDQAVNPLRTALWLPDRSGLLGMMPGYLSDPAVLGLKVVGVFPGNHGGNLDSHQGFVALFDEQTGVPSAILEASEITAIRTAAASGVATQLLANADASELGILGSGVQARSHLAAMLKARPIRRVRVFSPNAENCRAFAKRESARHGIPVLPMETAQEAVQDAQILCTVTSSREPVLEAEWLSPGVHINAAGASIATARELDTQTMQRARLFVDRRESTLNEAGDFLIPKQAGAIGEEQILGEIGELLLKRVEGRRTPTEITLFKSLGLAAQDLISAQYVQQRALEQGVGTHVNLTGSKDED